MYSINGILTGLVYTCAFAITASHYQYCENSLNISKTVNHHSLNIIDRVMEIKEVLLVCTMFCLLTWLKTKQDGRLLYGNMSLMDGATCI